MDAFIFIAIIVLIACTKKSCNVSQDKLRDECKIAYKNGFRDGQASMMGDNNE